MAHSKATFSKVAAPIRSAVVVDLRWSSFPYLTAVMAMVTVVSIFHVWSRVEVIDMNLQIVDTNSLYKEQQQENKRLKLEVASLKTPARIESLAKGELGMTIPTEQQVVVVK